MPRISDHPEQNRRKGVFSTAINMKINLVDLFRTLMTLGALCTLAGCTDAPGDPQLEVTRFDVWKVPSSGSHLPAPRALYSDELDNVYVLDDAGRILVYRSDGTLDRQWEMPAHDVGRPEGIWKLNDDRVAVADTHYHRVVLFEPDGSVSFMFGSKGNGPGEFVFPVAVAQDPHGFLYVGEYGDRQRIQKFTTDGKYVTEFGQHGTEDGQFQRPSAIVWHKDTVYAVDAFNNRIQVFSDDGKFLRVIQLPESSAPLSFPYDLKLDVAGRLFVVENKAGRLTILRDDGSVEARFGHPSRGLDGFFTPWGVAVLSDGRVIVADTGNHRLVELTL
jgi:DNA-binding beta-propeller fold protein YncE